MHDVHFQTAMMETVTAGLVWHIVGAMTGEDSNVSLLPALFALAKMAAAVVSKYKTEAE